MSQIAVILNGVPGAGKTTLARLLGPELGFPVVSRDAIKEALADLVSVDLPTQRVGALAADAMWAMVGMIERPTLVESFWATGRDETHFERGLTVSHVERGIEVWCEVPLELARGRYIDRPRHRVHTDLARLAEWDEMARDAGPISHFPMLRVDTSGSVDVSYLADTIRQILGLADRVPGDDHLKPPGTPGPIFGRR
jgi:hypothetical protein